MRRFERLFQLEPTAWKHSAAKQSFLQHARVESGTIGGDVSLWWWFTEVRSNVIEHLICNEIESTCDIWRGWTWLTYGFIFRARGGGNIGTMADGITGRTLTIWVSETLCYEPKPLFVLTEMKYCKHNRILRAQMCMSVCLCAFMSIMYSMHFISTPSCDSKDQWSFIWFSSLQIISSRWRPSQPASSPQWTYSSVWRRTFPEGTLTGNTFSFIIFPAVIAGSACLLSPRRSNLHGWSGLHAIPA